MGPEYVPGKCNIGRRGRTIRLTTGLVLIVISIVLGLTVLSQVDRLFMLVLVLPAYVGLVAVLEGSMSFCVLHARRGTYDMHEPLGFASSQSPTLGKVESEEWKRVDRQKALRMHLEALAGAVVLAVLLAFA
ncbi:MAG TPA: hypothetical protein VFJ63_01735 [Candidatus Bathyarchaeia archaeon]|nr:hypothetical protein [Candidatus Bathyarchaeia archaeon]